MSDATLDVVGAAEGAYIVDKGGAEGESVSPCDKGVKPSWADIVEGRGGTNADKVFGVGSKRGARIETTGKRGARIETTGPKSKTEENCLCEADKDAEGEAFYVASSEHFSERDVAQRTHSSHMRHKHLSWAKRVSELKPGEEEDVVHAPLGSVFGKGSGL
ncbi:hypothetical protein U1Q18_025640 [Sarracenia purpurea var. burkii]